MLVLVLIDVRYIQNVVVSFEKGSNGQNHTSSDSHHPITHTSSTISHPPPLTLPLTNKAVWKTLDNWRGSYGLLNL